MLGCVFWEGRGAAGLSQSGDLTLPTILPSATMFNQQLQQQQQLQQLQQQQLQQQQQQILQLQQLLQQSPPQASLSMPVSR